MSVGALPQEYITHRVTSGDVVPYEMSLTGIAARPLSDFSSDGRIWCEAVGTTLTLYSRVNYDGTFVAGDAIASGTIAANGDTPLTALNTSGITGNFFIQGLGKFDIIVGYTQESELQKYIFGAQGNRLVAALANVLDPTTRYEEAMNDAKLDLDRELLNGMVRTPEKFILAPAANPTDTSPFPLDSTGRYQMATMSAPKQLRRAHTYQTIVHLCNMVLLNFPDIAELCERFEAMLVKEIAGLRISIDTTGDAKVDEEDIGNMPQKLLRS